MLSKEDALELWQFIYGNSLWARDCFGTWMYRDDYLDKETVRVRGNNHKEFNYGWEIDHILPINNNGSDCFNNYEPMHWMNNKMEKKDNISFSVDGEKYTVVECKICEAHGYSGYGIIYEKTGERVDWKARQKTIYKKKLV